MDKITGDPLHGSPMEEGKRTRNWIWWEIERSKAEGKGLIAVKIKSTNLSPEPLMNAGAKWAMSYGVESILKAINEA